MTTSISIELRISNKQFKALARFYETYEFAPGHDVPDTMMQQLATIGLVRKVNASTYEMTMMGDLAVAAKEPPHLSQAQIYSNQYLTALAEIRDMLPTPVVGTDLHDFFDEAIAIPESVPAYVRAVLADRDIH